DLSSYGNDATRFPADWQAIADWFNQDQSRAIICDGRMISSYWNGRHTGEGQKLTENYYENTKAHGGGIILGTDHTAFQPGINEINRLIGLEPFKLDFSLSRIPVDTASPLMTFPNNMGVDLFDDSSPGQTPFGLQPNGRILYTVAWHSNNTNTPGISSTIKGFIGMHAAINSPANNSTFNVLEDVTFTASVINATPPVNYPWTSSINDEFSQEQSPTISTLDPGTHTITLLAIDFAGAADTSIITITILDLPDLEISATSAPDSAYASQAMAVNWTVTNLREKVTEGTWTDAVYLSDDDQPGGDVLLTSVERLNQLGLNESYNQSAQATIPASTTEGPMWIIIKTNNTGSLTETSDENNTSTAIPV
ncbi:MAG: hypothetical protein KAS23_11925, partial [Anaerohalosphaera sp.]|nr:hypothetical protein [Anaerohalosphaera sp.]